MDINLCGRRALVCGASQGIGRAAAYELAALGADVIVLARSPDKLQSVIADLPKTHAQQTHGYITADMTDHADLRRQIETITRGKPVNILINNTGGPPSGPAYNATTDAYIEAFHQHLIANHIVLQAVLPGMQNSSYGRIINVISTSVKEPIKNLGVSNTIRGAVASWAKTLASELGPYGITVNNVLPGYTKTQRLEQILADRAKNTGKSEEVIAQGMLASVPLARFAEASEIASVIAFLASPAAAYVNGINVPVDGGRTLSL